MLEQKFAIKFSFQPEDPVNLTDSLTGMALQLLKYQRKSEVLTLYRAFEASLSIRSHKLAEIIGFFINVVYNYNGRS